MFAGILDIPRYRLLLFGIIFLTMLAPLGSAITSAVTQKDGSKLVEYCLFTLAILPIVGLVAYWSRRQSKAWPTIVAIVGGWALSTTFIAIFSDDLSNAYLSSLLLILFVFLLYGPRFGVFSVALVLLADAYDLVAHPGSDFVTDFYTLTIEITVGILAWMFLNAANTKRDEAMQAASEARQANAEIQKFAAEAQRLSSEVTNLNHALLGSQDRERNRLARDIHDGPLQSMGVEMLAISRMKKALETSNYDRIAAEMAYLEYVAREAVGDLRQTVHTLRNTVLDLGIAPALYNLARKTREATNIEVGVTIDLVSVEGSEGDGKIPEAIAACIHQLTIEALNNVRKHARANKVAIHLSDTTTGAEHSKEIILTIEDDGQGFDYKTSLGQAMKDGHIGLYSMNERAEELGGRMAVTSAVGKGTTVSFTFPMTSATTSTAISQMSLSGPPTKPLLFLVSASASASP